MLRRIIPTAERTVTRGGNKTIDKGGAIRERHDNINQEMSTHGAPLPPEEPSVAAVIWRSADPFEQCARDAG